MHRESMWAPVQPGTARVAMVELQQPWVQEAVDSMVKCLQRENIQKMQGLMVWCSAGCCIDSQASL